MSVFLSYKTLYRYIWLWLLFISIETGIFILGFIVYFSMPETNYSASPGGRCGLIPEYIQDLNILYCRPHSHELVFIRFSLHGMELISVSQIG